MAGLGKPKTGGRKKGSLNKATIGVKDALTQAFENLGGVASLVAWGEENKTEFYKLWSKLIPVQQGEGQGEEAQPLHVTFEVREPIKEVRTTNAKPKP